MKPIPVIAIFDVGKTNKKLFLFDEDYQIVYEKSARFIETVDEDGFPCENLDSLRQSVFDSMAEIFRLAQFEIKAVNFSTYGASLVYVEANGKPLAPLYNYLKPYPEGLNRDIYDCYGGAHGFAAATASPILGSLNSGMQLLRLKREKAKIFKAVKYALHLPQYLSFLISGQFFSDITSIGCHTALWDFTHNRYHEWVEQEGLAQKLAPIKKCDETLKADFAGKAFEAGIGLHDSSAALIPYLVSFHEPFVLISTGTWCISMNPFNHSPLTGRELQNDCLCYLEFSGKPVKAARVFSGYEHEQQVNRIAAHFGEDTIKFRAIAFDAGIVATLRAKIPTGEPLDHLPKESAFQDRDLAVFNDATEAYHQLIIDLMQQQVYSLNMVLKGSSVKRIFVDGGFSKNAVYMNLLAIALPDIEIFAASMAQATAMGAALAIHQSWNTKPVPGNIIALKYYAQRG